MRITVFGANGKTGREILARGILDGHTMTAFTRHPESLKIHPAIILKKGDVRDFDDVLAAVQGADAVLYAIGSKPSDPKPACAPGMEMVLRAMKQADIRRLIALSAYGARDTNHGLYAWMLRTAIEPLMLDKDAMEDMIEQSDRGWTILRAARLTNGKLADATIGKDIPVGLFSSVSRKTVASAMLTLAKTNAHLQECISIKS